MGMLSILISYSSTKNISYFTAIILCSLLAYVIWKRYFGSVLVNCWFCNTNLLVPRRKRNSWTCSNCKQYNGFTESGDYNETFPPMYNEEMNAYCIGLGAKNHSNPHIQQHVKLCSKCTRDQHLKIKQLSQFKPIVEKNFETEAKDYKKKLDSLYALCGKCQDASDRYIKMQDTIIRGSMMSVKQQNKIVLELKQKQLKIADPGISKNFKIKNQKSYRDTIALIFWVVVFILSILYTYYKINQLFTSIAFFSCCTFLDTFGIFCHEDVIGYVLISGCSCSIVVIRMKRSSCSKCDKLSVTMWFICLAMALATTTEQLSQESAKSVFIQLIRGEHSSVKTPIDAFPKTPNDHIHGATKHIGADMVCQIFCCVMLLLSSICSLHYSLSVGHTQKVAKLPLQNVSKPVEVRKHKKQLCHRSASFDNTFSDCSMPSEEDDVPVPLEPMLHHVDNHFVASDPGLNGSLNALNLRDDNKHSSSFAQFKHPDSRFGENMLPSTLHTPPPSRSSSLLSLSSHQSGFPTSSAGNSITKFGATSMMDFTKSEMPCQNYKTSATIGGWTQSQLRSPSVEERSLASYAGMSWEKSSHLLNSAMQSHITNAVAAEKPLISPAKLHWHDRAQLNKHQCNSSKQSKFLWDNSKNSWEQKIVPDISIHDSVSQVGECGVLELSDDDVDHDILRQSPRRRKKMDPNSSSPKSTISNLTSVTMRGVEEVERSRFCRWLLAGCLLLNLVLLVLLILEVKEMRELEQWKSRKSSL